MESILATTKKMLGIAEDYTHFDIDIIVLINSALMTLRQLGVGPEQPVSVNSSDDTWNSIFGDVSDIESVKTYIYLKVRVTFDPPTSSFVLDAINRQISEIEWRLNIQRDREG